MDVLLVSTGLGVGGAEMQVRLLANELQVRGLQVGVLALTGENIIGGFNSEIKVFLLDLKKNPLSLVKGFLSFRRILNEIGVKVVHSHMIHANIFVRFERMFGLSMQKLVCTSHNITEGGVVLNILYRLSDRWSDFNTQVSQKGYELYVQKRLFKSRNSIFMPNGIKIIDTTNDHCKTLMQNKTNVKKILMVGRLYPAKGYDVAIAAFAELAKQNIDFSVAIAGEGPERGRISSLISRHHLNDKVTLLGLVENVKELMSESDLFVMSSRWEGTPMVLLEAAISCLPIVATDVGGIGHFLKDESSLVQSGDYIGLASAILYKLTNPPFESDRLKFKEEVIKQYNISSVVDKWLKIYFTNN